MQIQRALVEGIRHAVTGCDAHTYTAEGLFAVEPSKLPREQCWNLLDINFSSITAAVRPTCRGLYELAMGYVIVQALIDHKYAR
jgi:hypothetical protein